MAIGPEFDPQGNVGTPVLDAGYRAVEQRQSMMQRAQQLEQQRISTEMLEAKKQEWDMYAPMRQKQFEVELAETGAKAYTANLLLDEQKKLVTEWPTIMEKVRAAQLAEKNQSGRIDYQGQISRWADVMVEASKYSNTAQGKQAFEMAKQAMDTARVLNADQTREEIAKLKAQNDLGEMIVNNRVYKFDPRTKQMAPEKGAYPDADQSFEIERAKAAGKEAGESGVKSFKSILSRGEESRVALAKLQREQQVLTRTRDSLGAGFNVELGLRSVGEAFGWGDKQKLSNMQQLRQINADRQLTEATRLRGQGSITEGERAILLGAINNPTMTFESNMAITNAFKKIYERDAQIAELAIDLKAQNPSWTDDRIDLEVSKWRLRNPLDLSDLYSYQSGIDSGAPAPGTENSYLAQRRAALQGNKK